MEINTVFLSLGSNKGERIENIQNAITQLKSIGEIIKVSEVYETSPVGFEAEENFFNICLIFKTKLRPLELLKSTQEIEIKLGRKKTKKKGYESREIDVDIIFFNNIVLETDNLTIPHPHYHNRAFVLYPLNDLDKGFLTPLFKKTFQELIQTKQFENAIINMFSVKFY